MISTRVLLLTAIIAFGTYAASANDNHNSSSSEKGSASEVRLSKLMDANIQSNTGEDLGRLQDLLIDPQTGEIKFAVLGRGGVLGIGEKYVPVPWKAIQVQSEKQFTLNVDKKKLKTAPTTDKEFSNLYDPGYTVTIYRFFAVPAETGMGGSDLPGGSQQGAASSTNHYGTKPSSDTKAEDPSNKAAQH